MRKYSKYIYHGENWDIIFGDWKQHFLGYCIDKLKTINSNIVMQSNNEIDI